MRNTFFQPFDEVMGMYRGLMDSAKNGKKVTDTCTIVCITDTNTIAEYGQSDIQTAQNAESRLTAARKV